MPSPEQVKVMVKKKKKKKLCFSFYFSDQNGRGAGASEAQHCDLRPGAQSGGDPWDARPKTDGPHRWIFEDCIKIYYFLLYFFHLRSASVWSEDDLQWEAAEHRGWVAGEDYSGGEKKLILEYIWDLISKTIGEVRKSLSWNISGI